MGVPSNEAGILGGGVIRSVVTRSKTAFQISKSDAFLMTNSDSV